jgi:hypothetical protein
VPSHRSKPTAATRKPHRKPVRTPLQLLRSPLYERQIGESLPAWRAFTAYRDLGTTRSALAAYRQTTGKHAVEQASGMWTTWGTVWRWVDRAAAWDAHCDDEARRAEEEQARADGVKRAELRAAQRERELALGDQLLARVEEMLRVPVIDVRIERDESGHITQHFHPTKWRLGDTAALARVGVELRRMGLGLVADADDERNDLSVILARILNRVVPAEHTPGELTDAELERSY